MADLKDDLAALRIEREPDRPRAMRWVFWIALIVLRHASQPLGPMGAEWQERGLDQA